MPVLYTPPPQRGDLPADVVFGHSADIALEHDTRPPVFEVELWRASKLWPAEPVGLLRVPCRIWSRIRRQPPPPKVPSIGEMKRMEPDKIKNLFQQLGFVEPGYLGLIKGGGLESAQSLAGRGLLI